MSSLLTKKDLSLLINIYKKNGYTKLNSMIMKNNLDLRNENEKKALQKVVNISSEPAKLMKNFYTRYTKLVGGELKEENEEISEDIDTEMQVVDKEEITSNESSDKEDIENTKNNKKDRYNYNPTIINNIYKKEDIKSKATKPNITYPSNNQPVPMIPYQQNQQYMVPFQQSHQYMVPYQPNQQPMIPINTNFQNSNIPLTYNLPKEEKNDNLEDPQLKSIINNLEEHILKKIKDKNEIDKGLNSKLQQNIKAELKHRIMEEVKSELKDKIASYATQTLASKISKDDDRKSKHDSGSVYQDTVPPFFRSDLVLP